MLFMMYNYDGDIMRKYLYDYIENIDRKIRDGNIDDKCIKVLLIKISFFQHERFIHLVVTLFYVLMMLIFFALGNVFIGFLIIGFILMIFVIFYIIHYFKLENGVQYLYKQYDKMNKN